jgi:Uma2 family endonuclease
MSIVTPTRLTADDVLRLSEQGKFYELVNGELVPMSPTGFRHGQIEVLVSLPLNQWVTEHRLGVVVVGDVLFYLDRAAGLARAADVAFVRADRLPAEETPLGAFIGAPDLAVEIVSPSNTALEIHEKIGQWLSHGTLGVLVIYPELRSAVLWKRDGARRFGADEEVDLDPIVPGFRIKVSALLPP